MNAEETADLVADVARIVHDIKHSMGLRDWVITVKGATDAEVRRYSGQRDVLACTGIFIGTRRANISINTESDWVDYVALEGTIEDLVTHELLHIVFCDSGMAYDGKLITNRMEEGIDRLVSIINGGSNEENAEIRQTCACCGTV